MHIRFFLIQNHYDLQKFSINERVAFVKNIRLKGGFALSIQFLQQLAQCSNKEIVAIARAEGFDISSSEVKKLRPHLEKFSFTWLFVGIPKDVLVEIEAVLGRKRSRQLIALFTK